MQVATVGHVPTSSFSVLCASASTVPGRSMPHRKRAVGCFPPRKSLFLLAKRYTNTLCWLYLFSPY